jgi:hypothetical protein
MISPSMCEQFPRCRLKGVVGIGWVRSCNSIRIVRGIVPSIRCEYFMHCCNLLYLMLVTLGPSAMISDLNILCFHDDALYIVLDHICKLYTHVIIRNPRPRSDNNRETGGDGFDVKITCVHGVLMLCSGTLLKGVT